MVTGATGTVGREVVKQLLSAKGERKEEDIIVKAAARSADDSTFRNPEVQAIELDFNNRSTLSAALDKYSKSTQQKREQSSILVLLKNDDESTVAYFIV